VPVPVFRQLSVPIASYRMLRCCTREVMSPQRPDLVLSAHIPDVELDVFVGNGLDVEADGGDGGDILVQFELV
jgi:hypothetical protein